MEDNNGCYYVKAEQAREHFSGYHWACTKHLEDLPGVHLATRSSLPEDTVLAMWNDNGQHINFLQGVLGYDSCPTIRNSAVEWADRFTPIEPEEVESAKQRLKQIVSELQ